VDRFEHVQGWVAQAEDNLAREADAEDYARGTCIHGLGRDLEGGLRANTSSPKSSHKSAGPSLAFVEVYMVLQLGAAKVKDVLPEGRLFSRSFRGRRASRSGPFWRSLCAWRELSTDGLCQLT
jgi:hypothetical protein